MDIKIAIVLALVVFLAFSGCAKKGAEQGAGTQSGQGQGTPDQANQQPSGASAQDQELADLFRIDTDKPLSDEGFGVSTPGSEE